MCDKLDRLAGTAARVTELEEALSAERERRDIQLGGIRDGCAHTWAEIAVAARLAPSRCHELWIKNSAKAAA